MSTLLTMATAKKGPFLLCLLLVTFLSYFSYFLHYEYPPSFFWDENYHIASAQKYLNGVFFMEQHPPLGKMLIALGEKMLNANKLDNQFLDTDYGRNPPDGFSFAGYRFFPTLLAWLAAPLLFFLFWLITKNHLISIFLSFFYVFDNAIIVHSRSAMLESTLMFFIILTIVAFLLLLNEKHTKRFLLWSILFGAAFGAVMTTKLVGLIVILLVPALLWAFAPDWNKFLTFLGVMSISFVVVFLGVWATHFSLIRTVNPELENNGFYQASETSKQNLSLEGSSFVPAFSSLLWDAVKYPKHYNRGVPRLDLCKPDENGSPFFLWPLGARSINYRWETPDSTDYRYLYLQANPVVWWLSFGAVLMACGIIVSSVFFAEKFRKPPFLLLVFTGLYGGYMVAISQLDRVMYLYHYFTPLLFSMILLGLVLLELKRVGPWLVSQQAKNYIAMGMGILVFVSFQFYRPFTYYTLINDTQFERRNIFRLWDLRCVKCDRDSPLVVPRQS